MYDDYAKTYLPKGAELLGTEVTKVWKRGHTRATRGIKIKYSYRGEIFVTTVGLRGRNLDK